MGMVAAVSFCTVLYLFQPAATVSQTPLGKPGEAAPTVTPAEPAPAPVAAPTAPLPATTPPAAIAQPVAAPPSAPAPQPAAPRESGGRVAAFWVFLPES